MSVAEPLDDPRGLPSIRVFPASPSGARPGQAAAARFRRRRAVLAGLGDEPLGVTGSVNV